MNVRVVASAFLLITVLGLDSFAQEQAVKKWLEVNEKKLQKYMNQDNVAQWAYYTNITDVNAQFSVNASADLLSYKIESAEDAKAKFPLDSVNISAPLRRLLKKRQTIGIRLSPDDSLKLSTLINNMTSVYSTASICSWQSTPEGGGINCSAKWSLEPEIETVMAKSENYEELLYVWKAWRDEAGKPNKASYNAFVKLSNKGAQADKFKDTGDYWRSLYEDENFQENLETIWQELLPLYEQLHAYVRRQLKTRFGEKFGTSSTIPAHLLGNMWAQTWTNLYSWTAPYPYEPSVDVTEAMLTQNYTALKMFRTAEDFFASIGFSKMTDTFWKNSMIVKPTDGRSVVCHASAWDFMAPDDFRIKMCTEVSMEELVTIHHEMGHVEYFMQYANQSTSFRDGANPGFHEAVGDTIALSVNTPSHLNKLGLLGTTGGSRKQTINYLYKQALEKIAFLPFGYLIDQWRWKVFDGTFDIDNSDVNSAWWELRKKYQGIWPGVSRSQDDFDPAAKYHVSSNTPYIRYFVSFIVQFQFYEALCKESGHVGPLHECDYYRNKEAGNKLRKALEKGSSVHWSEVLYDLTEQKTMSAKPLVRYFAPLLIYLDAKNTDECFGWGHEWSSDEGLPTPRCGDTLVSRKQVEAKEFLKTYNNEAQQVYFKAAKAEFDYWKNLTNDRSLASVKANAEKSIFNQKMAAKVEKTFNNMNDISNDSDLRQLNKIGSVSIKLDEEKTLKLGSTVNSMMETFSNAKICNYTVKDCSAYNTSDPVWWDRDPTLSILTAKSQDYDLLEYIWKEWRSATGAKMRNLFNEYVDLSNEGAKNAGAVDAGESWRSVYETPDFQVQLEKLWRQVLPLYEQLHAYVRTKLRQTYAGKYPKTNAIPAHILGNMWAQEWNNIFDATKPYSDVSSVDVTPELKKQGYTPKRMFETAEDFFTSIGLYKMRDEFWKISLIEKPTDGTSVQCYPNAEEFYDGKNFGIIMCTKVSMEDLITIHHEMGHIEYFMSYSHQPLKFRDSANPGFHEAIGDTMALSASTPKHLNKIGLLNQTENNVKEQAINFLYKTALSKIAFLPFGYLIDKYRWKVFDGSIPREQLNAGWWALRQKYQGLVPPDPERIHNETYLDAAAKFHVTANVPYIRYFVSFIVQFQFHDALCKLANQTGPLHECDIYKSRAAGEALHKMLQLGSSVPWTEAMKTLTGQAEMSAEALIRYFEPLLQFLEQENKKHGVCFGWGYKWPDYYNLPHPRCQPFSQEEVTSTTLATPSLETTKPTKPKTKPTDKNANVVSPTPSYGGKCKISLLVIILPFLTLV